MSGEIRYAMVVDPRRCVGCNACVIGCKAENRLPPGAFRDWIVQETTGRFPTLQLEIRSERCNHCSDPPCVRACPSGSSYVADGGAVIVDPAECTGCKACLAACPYDARYVHPEGYVDKCTFCLHRVRKGQPPACVDNCPTKALVFGDASDPRGEVARLLAARKHRTLKPETGAEPNVYFLED